MIDYDRISEMKEYIDNNLRLELSIHKLSEKFGMSKTTLRRQFRNYNHQSVFCYIYEQRMKLSCRLLQEQRNTIYEISEITGYKDCSTFTHAFTKYFGKPPSVFLEKYIKHSKWTQFTSSGQNSQYFGHNSQVNGQI